MNTENLGPKIALVFFFLTFATVLSPGQTFAEGMSLKVSPSLFRIQAKPPADVWTPFVIENQSDQPISLKIGYKPIDPLASSNGTVVFLKNGQAIPGQDKKIFEKMQLVDDQNISHDTIDLGPQQKERLRLRILLPSNEPSSDYYFSLLFLQNIPQSDQNTINTNTEDQKTSVALQEGVGINVLLTVGDKEAAQGSIQTFSAPWLSNSGPIPFTLDVQNSGTHFIMPKGTILIKNMFGQTVGKVTIPQSVILARTSRRFASPNSQTEATLIWPEQFLLGTYTATLTLTLSDKEPAYVRTIYFLGLPIIFFSEILVVLTIIVYIYLRVKKKIS